MIDRYSVYSTASDLGQRFSISAPENFKSRYNAAPTQLLPVITANQPRGFSRFYWGTSPRWGKNKPIGNRLINTQAESITDRSRTRKALDSHRCLIPANSFFAWKSISKRSSVPYCVQITDREIFAMAGLWEEYEEEEQVVHTFSIVTVEAAGEFLELGERMPAILAPEREESWLEPAATVSQRLRLLNPDPRLKLTFHPVSNRLSSIDQDDRGMIKPTQSVDQFGNYSLFD